MVMLMTHSSWKLCHLNRPRICKPLRSLCKKVSWKFLIEHATRVLVHALVISRLDYCNSLYVNLPKCLIQRLQSVMNCAARIILKCGGEDSVTLACKQLHWLPIEYRIKFKLSCIVYKCLNRTAPEYLSDMLHPARASRTRASRENLLLVPKTNMKFGDRAFEGAGPRTWNELPRCIRDRQSLLLLKNDLKTFFWELQHF